MSDIPEDVMKAARDARLSFSALSVLGEYDEVQIIARAIHAAVEAEKAKTEALLSNPMAVNINILAGKIKLPRNYIEVPAGKLVMFADVDVVGDFSTAAIRTPSVPVKETI